MDDSPFSFPLWDTAISLDEIFYDMVVLARNSGANETEIDYVTQDWETCRALQRIYTRMDELNYDKIDWERGVKDGIFSLVNYYQIPALKKFKEQANKNYLDNYPKEEYDRGLQVIKELEDKYKE